jgi:hypothetical protein
VDALTASHAYCRYWSLSLNLILMMIRSTTMSLTNTTLCIQHTSSSMQLCTKQRARAMPATRCGSSPPAEPDLCREPILLRMYQLYFCRILCMLAKTEPLEKFRSGLCLLFGSQKSETLDETLGSALKKTGYSTKKWGQRIYFQSLTLERLPIQNGLTHARATIDGTCFLGWGARA